MKKIKIGVIGTGHLGSIHSKIWKTNPDAELVGIFDTDSTRANQIANELDVKNFISIDTLLSEVDAVTIASPTITHFEIAQDALLAGKHCFIEKPITSNHSEAMQLIETAKQRNTIVQVGHVERFNPAIAALDGMEISPLFIEAHRLSQFRPRAIDVSVIHDLMIHDIDIMLWLVKSKVKSIDANGVSVITDTIDIANARITFENGAVANLTASRLSANPMRKMRIFQKNAYISIDFGNQDVEVFKITEPNEMPEDANIATMLGSIGDGLKNKDIYFMKPNVVKQNAIEEEQKAFVRSILHSTEIAVNAYEAAEALRIAEVIAEMVE